MDYQVKQIAKALDAEVFGDGDIIISGVAEPSQAKSTDIALAMDAKYACLLYTSPSPRDRQKSRMPSSA